MPAEPRDAAVYEAAGPLRVESGRPAESNGAAAASREAAALPQLEADPQLPAQTQPLVEPRMQPSATPVTAAAPEAAVPEAVAPGSLSPASEAVAAPADPSPPGSAGDAAREGDGREHGDPRAPSDSTPQPVTAGGEADAAQAPRRATPYVCQVHRPPNAYLGLRTSSVLPFLEIPQPALCGLLGLQHLSRRSALYT